MTKFLDPIELSSWDDLRDLYEKNKGGWDGWIFRGQSFPKNENDRENAAPSLKSTLERALERFGLALDEARKWEYRILRDFKRRCHLVTTQLPESNNDMEWLALLRHYGGPARLLDWTYSFWVAVYFALDRAKDGYICEVWAMKAKWWRDLVEAQHPDLKQVLEDYGSNSAQESELVFRKKDGLGLWFLNPFRLNERLAAQQGLFVLPLDVTKSFLTNLDGIVDHNERKKHLALYRITATPEFLKFCFNELYRMNISRATMYPGIEGLAQQMENALAMPQLFAGIVGELGRPCPSR